MILTWPILVELLKLGLPAADYIIKQWLKGTPPTLEDWENLRKLAEISPETQILAVARRLGLDPADPRVKDLIALIPR